MMVEWMAQFGPWNWIALGLVLLALEILAPGVYLLWIGIAALLTGTLSFQLWETGFWTWQVQTLVFLALSVLSAIVGKKILAARRGNDSDQPLLNRRDAQLVGRTATLEEAIVNGQGRARIGDSLWIVHGPDLPAGSAVRISDATDGRIVVEPH